MQRRIDVLVEVRRDLAGGAVREADDESASRPVGRVRRVLAGLEEGLPRRMARERVLLEMERVRAGK